MLTLDAIAEKRIREAQERGELDGLPGAGAPLQLDDDSMVPEDLRVAFRILKNSGFLPPEIEAHREIRDIEQLLLRVVDDAERTRLLTRIHFLFNRTAGRRGNLQVGQDYLEKIADHLTLTRASRTHAS